MQIGRVSCAVLVPELKDFFDNKSIQVAKLAQAADWVIEKLEKNGEAYLVGGVVRDLLLKRPIHDVDITTSLKPQDVLDIFSTQEGNDDFTTCSVILTGIKHGTVTVVVDGVPVEVTTYRVDGAYSDGRHPDSVHFTTSLEEDLARRDFTINAMAMSRRGELFDYFGGLEDLEKGLIRAVGDPNLRFNEDALRILRGARFANRLNFRIEENTLASMRQNRELLHAISRERIASELLSMIMDNPDGVTRLHEWGILEVVYPELNNCFLCEQNMIWHRLDVGRHSVEAMHAHPDLTFRVACLLHDVGKPDSKTIDDEGKSHFYGHAKLSYEISKTLLRDFFLPKDQRRLIAQAVYLHDFLSTRPGRLARLLREEGAEVLELVFRVKRADVMAQSSYQREEKLALIDEQEALIKGFMKGPYRLQDLEVDGSDLVKIGYQGPEIQDALNEILVFVMERPERNERAYLLERAERIFLRRSKN